MKKSSVTVATVRALDQEFQLKKHFDLKKHSSGRVAVLRGSIVLDHHFARLLAARSVPGDSATKAGTPWMR